MTGLISVNGEVVDLAEALGWSEIADSPSFVEATAARVVLRQYAREQGFSADADEIQKALDDLRYDLGLVKAEETERWLNNSRVDPEVLRSYCEQVVLERRIWNAIPDEDVAAHFAQHENAYASVDLYGIRLKNAKAAAKLAGRLRNGEADFHKAAMEQSIDEASARKGGYLGRLRPDALPEEIRVGVFSVDPGDIIGPLKAGKDHTLFLVAALHRPDLESVADEIRDELFDHLTDTLMERAVLLAPE